MSLYESLGKQYRKRKHKHLSEANFNSHPLNKNTFLSRLSYFVLRKLHYGYLNYSLVSRDCVSFIPAAVPGLKSGQCYLLVKFIFRLYFYKSVRNI